MKNNKIYVLAPIFISIALALGVFLGINLSNPKQVPITIQNQSQPGYFGSKIEAIMYLIQQRYVDTINKNEFIDQAINDFLHELDPHSNYFSKKDMKSMMESINGEYAGVGIRFLIHNDTLSVTNVIAHSPSLMAGIKDGDRIIAVNGENISGKKITNKKVIKLLKGKPGTNVKVTILRNDKIAQHTITRGIIPIKSISCAAMINDNTGYIRLEQFSVTSGNEFHTAAMQLKKQGMKKLVFDLRDNGGGVMSCAIQIADEFLPKGKLIVYTQGAHQAKQSYFSTEKGSLEKIELVVLINSSSASASEIVSGAIQDNDRGVIMGRRSFGKGLVQEDIPLRDGSNVRLTIARYYTPTGRCIQKPYGKNIQDYREDFMHRYENGELYHVDSTILVDSLKFTTPKGKVVYGGGGIMPDIFVPYDSTGNSIYFSNLRYSLSFGHFAFDFVNRVGRDQWENEQDFRATFKVSSSLFDEFIQYSTIQFKIEENVFGLRHSKKRIEEFLKAEIARQIWIEQGYFTTLLDYDNDVKQAVLQLEN